jgi:hypothetical protein
MQPEDLDTQSSKSIKKEEFEKNKESNSSVISSSPGPEREPRYEFIDDCTNIE